MVGKLEMIRATQRADNRLNWRNIPITLTTPLFAALRSESTGRRNFASPGADEGVCPTQADAGDAYLLESTN